MQLAQYTPTHLVYAPGNQIRISGRARCRDMLPLALIHAIFTSELHSSVLELY